MILYLSTSRHSRMSYLLAPASYAQARLCLDQQISLHNMVFVYQLNPGNSLSVQQLGRALQLIVKKHLSLRTSLIFHEETNRLMQEIIHINTDAVFPFIENVFHTDEELKEFIYNEKHDSQLFNLAQGLVFRCHLVHYKNIPTDGVLSDQDVIIFNFHHALFDLPSMDLFLTDLNQAYTTGQLASNENNTLRYLDCNYQQFFLFIIQHFHVLFVRRCCDRT